MSFVEKWQAKLPASYSQFAQIAARSQDIDFKYGLVSTAILWPIYQELANEKAYDEFFDVCGPKANTIFKAIRRWDDDPEEAARQLSAKAQEDEQLRIGLEILIKYFDALSAFSENLAPLLVKQAGGGDTFSIAGQIKAALVNIGGVTDIGSLTNHIQSLTINITQTTAQLKILDPPQPIDLPETPGFIGREQELDYFQEKLLTCHLAIISGWVGVGKTTLAAALAHHYPTTSNKIFWYEFKKEEGVEAIIHKLAGFLAWHGHSREVWDLLEQTRLHNSASIPPSNLFRFLFEQIRRKGFLLCLDNFHFVQEDPLMHYLADEIRPAVLKGELAVVLVSQSMPDFVQTVIFKPLTGLSLTDTQQLLVRVHKRISSGRGGIIG